jgi:hypothetical protein
MVWAEPAPVDGHRTDEQGPSSIRSTLVGQDAGEMAEADGGVEVVGAQASLPDSQGTLVKTLGAGEITLFG